MTFMQGLDLKSIKKHPSLIPLFFVLGLGCCTATFYILRLATKNPDVTWSRKNNPEPWNEYKDKRYQFLDPAKDDKTQIKRPSGSLWS